MVTLTEAKVEVFKIDDEEEGEQCAICGSIVMWQECSDCGGTGGSDAYELMPLEYDPGERFICDTCNGERGWYLCLSDYEYHNRIGIERGKITA